MLTAPIQIDEALDSLLVKRLLPTADSSAVLFLLAPEIRERSILSARTLHLSHIAEIADVILQITTGELDIASARVRLRQSIAATGYSPDAEGVTPGSLEDLSSTRRLELVLDTNTRQAQGYADFVRGNNPVILDQWPALELFRSEDRKEKRHWPSYWLGAGGKFYGGMGSNPDYPASPGRMIALKDSPVWAAISRFGTPYPPFDFNSGMWVREIERDEAEELGLLTSRDIPKPQTRRFNENLTVSFPESLPPSLRQAVAEAFADSAIISGDTITLLPNRAPGGTAASPSAQPRAANVGHYDPNQPRDQEGQFASTGASGATGIAGGTTAPGIPKHIANGSSYTITRTEAAQALKTGFTTTTANGKTASFGEWLHDKYVHGKGRKEGPDPERITHLAQAVATVKYANKGVTEVPGEQYQYLHRFKNASCVAFADITSGKINGFIYEYGNRAEKLIKKYK